ncbi:MAG: SLC13 family permease [Pseudomonadales bacterium]
MDFIQISVAITLLALVLSLILSQWRPSWIFGFAALFCYVIGAVNTEQLLSKVVNPGLATLVLLLLVSIGLEKIDWMVRVSRRLVSKSYTMTLLRLGGITALLSAFLNNTAVVAVLANGVTKNGKHPASRLLIPLSYAAILGGTTTLIGTSTNLIVNSFLIDAGEKGFEFFDFFIVGIVATIAGLTALLFSARLLPITKEDELTPAEYLIEARIVEGSSLIGHTVAENKLRQLESLFLVEIIRDGKLLTPVSPYEVLELGDVLIFSGDVKEVGRLEGFEGLETFATTSGLLGSNLTEVVVLPNATIAGRTIKQVGFRAMFDSAVVGMRRGGMRLSGKLGSISLRAGDSLLLAVGPDFSTRQNISKNFAVLSGVEIERSLSNRGSALLMGAFACVVVLSALQIVSLFKGLVLLLGGLLAFRVVSSDDLKRRFPHSLLVIIASALIIAQALSNSGLVDMLTGVLHQSLSSWGPLVALVGVFLATLVLTEVMTNNAAAALAFPVAFTLAESFGVNWMPFVMAVAYGASASFLTPYGYTTNLMVQNISGYQLRDYVRTGLPVAIAYSITALIAIPIVFPF